MFLSYAILTHNEGKQILNLLDQLIGHIKTSLVESEIVIVDDNSKDPQTQMILKKYSITYPFVAVVYRKNEKHFADQKNVLTDLCSGEWIFNLDADETVSNEMLEMLPKLIESNPTVDAYWIPRLNIVDGLTQKHVQKWGWKISYLNGIERMRYIDSQSEEYQFLSQNTLIINEEESLVRYKAPVVMWPDYQMRLYKNDGKIKWVNPVHEVLVGYKTVGKLPDQPEYAIQHFKNIERQEQQNELYDKIQKDRL